ncbi:hypothetical protein GCM10018954_037150 [Kutzneria kofuensis]
MDVHVASHDAGLHDPGHLVGADLVDGLRRLIAIAANVIGASLVCVRHRLDPRRTPAEHSTLTSRNRGDHAIHANTRVPAAASH